MNADDRRAASPWVPMTDPRDKKVIGKLLEETGELTSAAARCLIQGIDEREPVSGKQNRVWLEDEIADVLAGIRHTINRFKLDERRIAEREKMKFDYLSAWHDMREQGDANQPDLFKANGKNPAA